MRGLKRESGPCIPPKLTKGFYKTKVTHSGLKSPFIFNHWLVGFTDGDGTFTIDRQNNGLKWNLVYKISQAKVNGQLIHFIKKNIGVGHITTDAKNITFRVRDLNSLNTKIFPIFDETPCLTSKYFDYILIKEAAKQMQNKENMSLIVFNTSMEKIYGKLKNIRESGIETNHTIKLTDDWLLGFWEAEGSLYIVKKDSGKGQERYCHGLGITQKKDRRVQELIRMKFNSKSQVRFNNHKFYSWDSTSKLVVNKVIDFLDGRQKGRKSLSFSIWKKSLNYTGARLIKSRDLMRKIIS